MAREKLRSENKTLELEHLTRELDAIIESSSDGLFVCDGSGRIIHMNPASARINRAPAER